MNPYAHMPYVPTVPGERPVGHFPMDPETTYPPPPPPPQGEALSNSTLNEERSTVYMPFDRIA